MKKIIFIIIVLFINTCFSQKQQVKSIGFIEVNSIEKTSLINLNSSIKWLVFDTDLSVFQYWNGVLWVEFSGGSSFTPTDLLTDYSFTDNSDNWNTAFGWGDHPENLSSFNNDLNFVTNPMLSNLDTNGFNITSSSNSLNINGSGGLYLGSDSDSVYITNGLNVDGGISFNSQQSLGTGIIQFNINNILNEVINIELPSSSGTIPMSVNGVFANPDGSITIPTGGGSGDVTQSGTNTFTGTNDFTGSTITVPTATASNEPTTLSQMNAAIASVSGGGSGTGTNTVLRTEILNEGINLYNKADPDNDNNGWLNSANVPQSHVSATHTKYFPVEASEDYWYLNAYGASTNLVIVDDSFNVVRSIAGTVDGTITIAASGEAYVRFSVRDINDFMFAQGSTIGTYEPYLFQIKPEVIADNPFASSKMVAFGDSITALPDNWTVPVDTIIKPQYIDNFAISGQRIAWTGATVENPNPPTDADPDNVLWNSIKEWEATTPDVPDYIFIALGTNDISQGSALGSFEDAFAQDEASTTHLTMAGAFRKALVYLQTTYPDTKLYYITPLQSKTGGRNYNTITNVGNILSKVARRLNVNVIDATHQSGIEDEFENVGTAGRDLYDGTHPNANGAYKHGLCVSNGLRGLLDPYNADYSQNITFQDSGVDVTTRPYLNFVGSGVIVSDNAGNNSTDITINGGGGASNPNIVVVTSESDIYNASSIGKVLEIQSNIILTADRTLSQDATLKWAGGSLILDGFTLTGDNNSLIVEDDFNVLIDAFTGTIDGTWNTPDKISVNAFGAKHEGNEVSDGNITLGSTTLTSATANFSANDVGKWISIIEAGAPPEIEFTYTSGTFTQGETLTFSGGATATLTTLATSDMIITMTGGNTPQKDETITGGTSGATATVDGSTEDGAEALVGTITSFTSATEVEISVSALSNATNTIVVYGWNDRNAMEQAAYVRNRKSGTLIFPDTYKYYFDVIQSNPLLRLRPYSFIIGDDTDGVVWEVNGHIQAFPHETQDSKSFVIWRTNGSGILGSGKIYGDYIYHTHENSRGEGNHGIFLSTLATNCFVKGSLDVSWWYGDALYGSGDTQFMNQIDGANFVDGSTESTIAQGNILNDGTIDLTDTEWWYSETLMTLTGSNFDNITSRGLQRFVHLTGASFGGWENMRNPYFKIAFYNDADEFQFITHELTWFDKVHIEDGHTQARVVFTTPLTPADVQLNLRPDLNPDGSLVEGITMSHCGRQGISNWASNTTIRNCWFHHIGGLDAGPGYGIDYEDGGRIKKNIIIENCLFENNWGDIILKGCENVVVTKNTFKASTIPTNNSTLANIETGVSSLFGRNVKVTENTFYNKRISVDRQDHVVNNIVKGGELLFSANGNLIENNQFWNVYLAHASDSSRDRQNHPTIIKNNEFKYNQRKFGYWFYNTNNAASFIDNIFKWNDVGDWNFDAESSDAYMVAGLDDNDQIYLDQSQTSDFGGISKGNVFEGILPESAVRDYSSGDNRPLMTSSEDNIYNISIEHTHSLPVSYTYKNRVIYGWLEYDFNQYETSIVSATPTISHIGGKIHIRQSDSYAWVNNGSNILSTASRNANLYFKDFSFIHEGSFTRTDTSQKFMDINHLGTTVFENCVFDMQQMPNYVMDLTFTQNFGSTLGEVTFIDPVFKNGFSVVLRTGDKLLFTKPNENCPSYADNATALAALGAGYYYKDSSNSDRFEITY